MMALTAVTILALSSCGTTQQVPLTGRTHRISVSDEQVLSLSNQEYTKYMASAKKSTNAANTAMVQRVGKKLANAVETYLKNNGFANDVKNYAWEFNLVQDKNVNAFCMPGGKIVVFEGLLPYTQNETCLAIVLGHEIAHAVAKHSAEHFSFRNLKYSRDNETEADYMGLIFAAMAGYDPQQAIPFWQRMSQGKSANQSDIFSDHPSDAKRIAALQEEMPEALKYYKPATSTSKTVKTWKVPTHKTTKRRK